MCDRSPCTNTDHLSFVIHHFVTGHLGVRAASAAAWRDGGRGRRSSSICFLSFSISFVISGRLVGVIGTAAIPTNAIASSSSLLVIFSSLRAVCFGRFGNCSLLGVFGRFAPRPVWTGVNFLSCHCVFSNKACFFVHARCPDKRPPSKTFCERFNTSCALITHTVSMPLHVPLFKRSLSSALRALAFAPRNFERHPRHETVRDL